MAERTYADALGALERALVFGIHPSLDGIRALTDALGRPQDAFASVQVTGTNGKTSTARLTAALLAAEGMRAGLYTSPHLERYPERIEVAGAPVERRGVRDGGRRRARCGRDSRPGAAGTPDGFTEFELLTAAALWHFAAREVDFAVLEVGMGGTWDATSVVSPAVAVITGVGLDHAGVLGDTVEQIAAEKAGIIKPGRAPVLGPGTGGLEAVFLERAEHAHTHARAVRDGAEPSPVPEALTVRFDVRARPTAPGVRSPSTCAACTRPTRGSSSRAPSYQAANVATAVAASEAALGRALDRAARPRRRSRGVTLPGRFELRACPPPLVVDGAHNPQAARVLAGAIAEAWPDARRRPLVVLGVLADKDAAGIVRALEPVAAASSRREPDSPRALLGGRSGLV